MKWSDTVPAFWAETYMKTWTVTQERGKWDNFFIFRQDPSHSNKIRQRFLPKSASPIYQDRNVTFMYLDWKNGRHSDKIVVEHKVWNK